jgi:hypothetical protein
MKLSFIIKLLLSLEFVLLQQTHHLDYYAEIRNILVWVGLIESSQRKLSKLLSLKIEQIFYQPRLPPLLDGAKVQDKMEALNLTIGIKSQKKILTN